jgi:hypothetical protein
MKEEARLMLRFFFFERKDYVRFGVYFYSFLDINRGNPYMLSKSEIHGGIILDIFEGVDTTILNDSAWALVKMIIIFVLSPGLVAGIIGKYVFKLRGRALNYVIVPVELAMLYYLGTHFQEIYNRLM